MEVLRVKGMQKETRHVVSDLTAVMTSQCKGQTGNREAICKSILQHTAYDIWTVTLYQEMLQIAELIPSSKTLNAASIVQGALKDKGF